MATKKKQQETTSVFFKPEHTGDMVEGIFGGFERSSNPDIDIPVMRVGDHKVGVSAAIKTLLAPVFSKLKVGKSRIKVVYLETVKTKDKKRRVNVFAVYVDGKQLEGKQGVPMNADEMKAFFAGTSKK